MQEKAPRALPADVPDYHARQASHLRALAGNATTPILKAGLLKEAEEHDHAQREVETAPRD
jgi:hypothetical protein